MSKFEFLKPRFLKKLVSTVLSLLLSLSQTVYAVSKYGKQEDPSAGTSSLEIVKNAKDVTQNPDAPIHKKLALARLGITGNEVLKGAKPVIPFTDYIKDGNAMRLGDSSLSPERPQNNGYGEDGVQHVVYAYMAAPGISGAVSGRPTDAQSDVHGSVGTTRLMARSQGEITNIKVTRTEDGTVVKVNAGEVIEVYSLTDLGVNAQLRVDPRDKVNITVKSDGGITYNQGKATLRFTEDGSLTINGITVNGKKGDDIRLANGVVYFNNTRVEAINNNARGVAEFTLSEGETRTLQNGEIVQALGGDAEIKIENGRLTNVKSGEIKVTNITAATVIEFAADSVFGKGNINFGKGATGEVIINATERTIDIRGVTGDVNVKLAGKAKGNVTGMPKIITSLGEFRFDGKTSGERNRQRTSWKGSLKIHNGNISVGGDMKLVVTSSVDLSVDLSKIKKGNLDLVLKNDGVEVTLASGEKVKAVGGEASVRIVNGRITEVLSGKVDVTGKKGTNFVVNANGFGNTSVEFGGKESGTVTVDVAEKTVNVRGAINVHVNVSGTGSNSPVIKTQEGDISFVPSGTGDNAQWGGSLKIGADGHLSSIGQAAPDIDYSGFLSFGPWGWGSPIFIESLLSSLDVNPPGEVQLTVNEGADLTHIKDIKGNFKLDIQVVGQAIELSSGEIVKAVGGEASVQVVNGRITEVLSGKVEVTGKKGTNIEITAQGFGNSRVIFGKKASGIVIIDAANHMIDVSGTSGNVHVNVNGTGSVSPTVKTKNGDVFDVVSFVHTGTGKKEKWGANLNVNDGNLVPQPKNNKKINVTQQQQVTPPPTEESEDPQPRAPGGEGGAFYEERESGLDLKGMAEAANAFRDSTPEKQTIVDLLTNPENPDHMMSTIFYDYLADVLNGKENAFLNSISDSELKGKFESLFYGIFIAFVSDDNHLRQAALTDLNSYLYENYKMVVYVDDDGLIYAGKAQSVVDNLFKDNHVEEDGQIVTRSVPVYLVLWGENSPMSEDGVLGVTDPFPYSHITDDGQHGHIDMVFVDINQINKTVDDWIRTQEQESEIVNSFGERIEPPEVTDMERDLVNRALVSAGLPELPAPDSNTPLTADQINYFGTQGILQTVIHELSHVASFLDNGMSFGQPELKKDGEEEFQAFLAPLFNVNVNPWIALIGAFGHAYGVQKLLDSGNSREEINPYSLQVYDMVLALASEIEPGDEEKVTSFNDTVDAEGNIVKRGAKSIILGTETSVLQDKAKALWEAKFSEGTMTGTETNVVETLGGIDIGDILFNAASDASQLTLMAAESIPGGRPTLKAARSLFSFGRIPDDDEKIKTLDGLLELDEMLAQ